MALVDQLKPEAKKEFDRCWQFANMEREALTKDLRKWLWTTEEHSKEYQILHDKVKTAMCKILLNPNNY